MKKKFVFKRVREREADTEDKGTERETKTEDKKRETWRTKPKTRRKRETKT